MRSYLSRKKPDLRVACPAALASIGFCRRAPASAGGDALDLSPPATKLPVRWKPPDRPDVDIAPHVIALSFVYTHTE
ncbi:hypothetical protein IscW_ISCW020664 [Ixodes scapularis]|uniref:Uncharacterized protein n=1 Tax=Ixodes scapularis TaxID=6945 RepID=B7Q2Q6_IXOSC|nr:hypothetical protein IscW_ISCW020664 [Ixodes scapularis]|eukprot:XP_002410936.1 hypothetical protein IscW_ISCW020664 [Ixodes scapularis]